MPDGPTTTDRHPPDAGMYCTGCGGALTADDAPRCPGCGRGFSPGNPMSYSAVPHDPKAWARSQRRDRGLRWVVLGLGLLLAVALAVLMFFAALGTGE